MFQLWRLCVVFLCCCCRRVAVACPVCRRMYLLPSFLPSFSCRRLWCGADGDRDFLSFFLQIAIHRPGTIKIVIENPCLVCIVTRRVHIKNTSWTPGCKLPKGGYTHLVKTSFLL
ncbi:hypothetical protein F5888DRAFT_1744858 [Russula emetica]|nr:hypothetical protein F5888DRAFT_1744858 [Russula emetica]